MHTTLTRARTTLVAPPFDDPLVDRRLSPLERLSLRLGLWLLLRGTARVGAPALTHDRAERDAARRAHLARAERERAWQRAALLSRPFL